MILYVQMISQFSSNFNGIHEFPFHFGLQNTSKNHLKLDSGHFWRQPGIDLVLQGRIWMDSECFGVDFSLIWARFCFWSGSSVAFANKSLDKQYALLAALNMARCFHIAFSCCHLVRRDAHRAWNPSHPLGCKTF